MKNFAKAATFLLVCGLAGSVMGQIAKSGSGYLFRVRYTPGQLIQFDTVTTSASKGAAAPKFKFITPMSMKVISVSKGVATVQVTLAPTTSPGVKEPLVPQQSIKVELDARNQATSKSVLPNPAVPYPVHTIKPGARWKAILPIRNPMNGSISKMDGEYLFAGMQQVDGHQVAVVTYSLNGFARGTGTMKLLAKDGSVYSNETTLTLTEAGSVDSVRITMARKK